MSHPAQPAAFDDDALPATQPIELPILAAAPAG